MTHIDIEQAKVRFAELLELAAAGTEPLPRNFAGGIVPSGFNQPMITAQKPEKDHT